MSPFADYDVVDLTVTLAEDTPAVWPGHMSFQHKVFNYYDGDVEGPQPVLLRAGPYQTRWILVDEHTGTHFDAPTHFIPPPGSGLPNAGPAGDVSADRVPLDQLMGPAAVIDTPPDPSPKDGVSLFIEPSDITAWEDENGVLEADDIVIFRSGWDSLYRRGSEGNRYLRDVVVHQSAPGWPAPSVETMHALLERGIRCIATDGPTMGAAHDGVPVHLAGLSAGAVYVEGLTNLAALPARGAWFCFAPIKVEGGSGAPGRAFAFVEKQSG
jgi:isatin hydrolase